MYNKLNKRYKYLYNYILVYKVYKSCYQVDGNYFFRRLAKGLYFCTLKQCIRIRKEIVSWQLVAL